MTVKEQFSKLKDNWLLITILIVGFIFLNGGGLFSSMSSTSADLAGNYAYEQSSRYYESPGTSDFAPGVEERLITKNANLQSTVERNMFNSADTKLRNIVESSESYLLKADVRENGDKSKSYHTGSYSIKVETTKYDGVVAQLKELADVTYFTESQIDITARTQNLQIELATEQTKLDRYNELYGENSLSGKTNLISTIADQERKIAYLKERLDQEAQKVSYSTIAVTLSEERPNFWKVKLVEFMELLEVLVNSFNSLLYVIFAVLPYAVFFAIVRIIYVFFTKKKSE